MTLSAYPSPVRAWLTVVVLMLAYVLSFIDRQILNLLVGPIKLDLQLSDTGISLLMGLSFALLYTTCGLPLGRLADSRNRRGLIAAGTLFWSMATAVCGSARNYWQLFLARIGVGIGEAALSPAAYSLIVDSFPVRQRATALSLYSMGIYVGSGLALLVGATVIQFAVKQGDVMLPLLGETKPWRLIFLLLGATGVLFLPLLLLLREPIRQGEGADAVIPLSEVLRHLKRNRRTVVLHNLGFACIALSSYGVMAWLPEFYVRTHGLQRVDVARTLGWLTITCSSAGILCGGALADWLRSKGHVDAPLRVGIVAATMTLLGIDGWLTQSITLAFLANGIMLFALAMPAGVAPAALQEIVPNAMRGQVSALFLFVISLIGLGIGPTAVALLTDFVFANEAALRYSLAIVTAFAGVAALILLLLALQPYRASLQRLQR